VRFQVFRNGQPVKKFRICGAYLFGTDGTSIRRAQIAFADGYIECHNPNKETAGLALLWPVEGFGRILLPTTCLPERERPYCLNVEISRARLMQTISRREDWSLFDGALELEDISKQARDLFIRSIQSISNPPVASQLADNSLRKAMIFSEKLATTHAETVFKTRRSAKGFGRACFGTCVDPDQVGNDTYLDRLARGSDFAMIPVNWGAIEQVEGHFDFEALDQCVDWLSQKKMILGAGPLLQFSQSTLPAWLFSGSVSFEKIRESAYRFVSEMVARYRRRIHRWIVVGGLNVQNSFGFNVEQVLEMTRAANMAAKAINSRAFRLIEVMQLWGEYYGATPNSITPVAYMDMVIQSGIPFDAFALQMQFGKNAMGMHVRDMMQISSILDYFSLMGKAMYLTGVEVPSLSGSGLYSGTVAGVWHKEWDTKRQALWLDQFYRIAMSKSTVEAVVYGNLADREGSVITHSGLLDQSLESKEGYLAVKRLRELVHSKN